MISKREYQIIKLVKDTNLKYDEIIKMQIEGKIVSQFDIADLTKEGFFEKRSTTCHTLVVSNIGLRALEEYEASLESSTIQLEANEIAKRANDISEKALSSSKKSNRIAFASLIIAVISAVLSFVATIITIVLKA